MSLSLLKHWITDTTPKVLTCKSWPLLATTLEAKQNTWLQKQPNTSSACHPQAGFSLMGVLLSLSLLSIGLLAITQAEITVLRTMRQAYFISLAEVENLDLVERWRSCQAIGHCLSVETQRWQQNIATEFPHGQTEINQQGSNYQSRVSWQVNTLEPMAVTLSFRL